MSELFIVSLKEITMICSDLLFVVSVQFLIAHMVLEVVTGTAEYDDAGDLDADVAPGAGGVGSEEGDSGGDHVGAEEGGGVHHELVCVVVSVPGEDDRAGCLDQELGVEGSELAQDEGPAD